MLKLNILSFAVVLLLPQSVFSQQQPTAPQPPVRQQDQRSNSQAEPQREEPRDQRGRTSPDRNQSRTGADRDHKEINSKVAECLLLKNEEGIKLAQFGLDRTQNADVKAFAENIIRQHEQLTAELEKYDHRTDRESERREVSVNNQDRNLTIQTEGVAQSNEPTDRGRNLDRGTRLGSQSLGERHSTGFRGNTADRQEETLQKIARSASELCGKMMREDLGKTEGEEFDKAFLAAQIGCHNALIAEMKASGEYVSEELSTLLTKSQNELADHKKHAEDLCEKLDGQAVDNSNPAETNSGARAD